MRINAVITEQAAAPKGLADILGKLATGDIVRAKVLEITSGELLLKLFDGSVLRAATASDIDTAPGENLELLVKGRNGGTLVLETVKKDAPLVQGSRNEAVKLLNDLNIKPDAHNLQLAGEIKETGINATRELFDKASQLLDKFKALTPEKAVFLTEKNISAEPRIMDAAIKLIEGNLKLGSQLEDLHAIISKLAEGSTAEKSTPGIHSDDSMTNNEAMGRPQPRQSGNIEDTIDNSKKAIQNAVVNGEISTEADLIETQQKTADMKLNKLFYDRQDSTAVAKGIPVIMPGEAGGFNSIDSDQELLIYKQKDPEENGREIKKLAGELKEAFQRIFASTDSEKLSSELDVKKIYKEIFDKLDDIKHISQSLSQPERADITARANNIEEGIKLLNQISTNSVYVQIPLNLSGFNTTSDLYIIKKDKSKKRVDPQNAVMLISLDTQNLGRVETLIDVKGKNVGINLRAEGQKVIDFIKENYRHLYSSLMDKGYRLVDVKYKLLEERTNPVNVERIVKKELSDGRMSVDLKI